VVFLWVWLLRIFGCTAIVLVLRPLLFTLLVVFDELGEVVEC